MSNRDNEFMVEGDEEEMDDLEMEGDDVTQEELQPSSPSRLTQAIMALTKVLSHNLVWYIAGLVDGVILLKLFGG